MENIYALMDTRDRCQNQARVLLQVAIECLDIEGGTREVVLRKAHSLSQEAEKIQASINEILSELAK